MQGYGGGTGQYGSNNGYNPNNLGGGGNYLQSQRTGFPGGGPGMTGMSIQPTGMGMGGGMMSMGSSMGGGASGMLPQRTGFPSQPQQPQQTGAGRFGSTPSGLGSNSSYSFLNAPPTSSQFNPNALSSQPTGFIGSNQTGGMSMNMNGMRPQATGFPSGGMQPQPTGYGGAFGGGGLQPQQTGMPDDPRLQMMAASFMPSNISSPFNSSGTPSFASPLSQPLPATFQSLLSNPSVATPKVPWTLSRQEKKDYDQIFRAWTGGEGGGYIEGGMAGEVFGQSGLGREDLMKIWNLSDINNRGKLNLPEFHVAMGLIYRALNGNDIPEQLPAEMIPPSMRDIDSTVDFVKDLLKNDNTTRASPSIDLPGTFSNQRNNKAPKDASVYKHDDAGATGYKSSARHLDRKQVRYEGEDKDSELSSIRRDLENSSKVLDRSAADFAERTEEDERLEQELDDLKYRVRRVKDDIEYVSRGKRSDDKDEERRKLERELLYLMHDRLPEVEKKIEEREEHKRREARDGIRARDKRNETYGRYRDRDYERDQDRSRYDDDRYRRGSRDNSRERRGSRGDYDSYSSRRPISPPPRDRTPPPAPAAPRDAIASPPPAPPAPNSIRTSAPATKSMTPEERTAFIRQQAQERLAARMRALGMAAPEDSPSAKVDQSVEERLAREKKEAEEKARQAEKQQEEREAARKTRLQQAGGGAPEPPVATSAPPTPLKSALKKAPAPPPPKPRVAPSSSSVPKVAPAPVATTPKEDPEDARLREQEEAHNRVMEERRARLKRMQEEEEETQKAEEAMMKRREALQKAESPAPTPAAIASPPPATQGSTNPFHRLSGASPAAALSPPSVASVAAGGGGGFNPFFRPPTTQTPVSAPKTIPADEDEGAPPPPPPPAPAPPAFNPSSSSTAFSRPPQPKATFAPEEEEWDVIDEKDNDSDSSDDEDYAGSRKQREAIARSLFGGPGSRDASKPASPAPVANKAALSKLGGGDPGNRGDLLSAIKMGAGLKKAVTNDRSKSQVTGKVVGDTAPPPHINVTPQEQPSDFAPDINADDVERKNANRQSVDWYSGLAADSGRQPAAEPSPMASVAEDEEPEYGAKANGDSGETSKDDLSEFDMNTTIRVRSLFPYDGQREVDLSFKENMVLMAHPAKDSSSPWWYGMLLQEGKSGWFPNNYVEEIKPHQAKASFPYTGNSDEELPFAEGDTLTVVDTSDADWWKAEKDGMIFIVPAAYLELLSSQPPAMQASATSLAQPDLEEPIDLKITPATSGEPNDDNNPSEEEDEGDTSSDDSYLSYFDDSDDDDQETQAARDQREQARQAILESAGLSVRRPPPGVPGPKKTRRREPPKPPSNIRQEDRPASPARDIQSIPPPLPPPKPIKTIAPNDKALQPDAYDRYEAYLAETTENASRARASSDARPPAILPNSPSAGSGGLASPSASSFVGSSSFKDTRLGGLVSRIGGNAAQSSSERKLTPAISGPVSVIRLEEVTEGDARTGPATWSSLVNAELRENITPQERKHQETIFEFIATESTYVRDLQLVVELFYTPLLQKLDDATLQSIFANIEDILLFNTTLLSSLEERQKSCRLYIDQIGDIFASQLPSVSVYKPYCINQFQGIRMLQSIRETNPEVQSLLQSIRVENTTVRSLDLSSFLLEPMQRLTRYPLLLRQILNFTESMEDQRLVAEALEAVEAVLTSVNESVRKVENEERLRILSEELWIGQGRLDLTAPTAFLGERLLLKEGELTKAKSGRALQVVLCNDILVLIESKNLYRMPFPIHEITAKQASKRDPTSFTIRKDYRESRKEDVINLKTPSSKEAQKWIMAINDAKAQAVRARSTSVKSRQRFSGLGY